MKKITILIIFILITFISFSCKENDDGYLRDKQTNPLINVDMGGNNELSIVNNNHQITIENAHTRIILNEESGSIIEMANKDAHVYLTKDEALYPFSVIYHQDMKEVTTYKNVSHEIISDTTNLKSIKYTWVLDNNAEVIGTIKLANDSDEIIFNVEIHNNDKNNPIYGVEYPVVSNIKNLYNSERDYLVHAFATGYTFTDPVTSFNRDDFKGINRKYGLYPSGWEVPMQFYAYTSTGIGGFMFMTKDGNDTIKSFPIVGEGTTLKASIYHYLNDLADTNMVFDYDISVKNLIKGTWYEVANIYQDWALDQHWITDSTKLSNRENINTKFYEDTALCNFNFPYSMVYGSEEQIELYELTKKSINKRHILNVFFNDGDGINKLNEKYDDSILFFEFPDFHSVNKANETPSEWNTAVIDEYGEYNYYNDIAVQQFYECASCEEYLDTFLKHEKDLYYKYKVDGYYHDVGIAAPHPKQCFNTTHNHGTRINVISDYINEMALICDLCEEQGQTLYGQELIFEQMIPYVNFYQARANASLVSFMEITRIRKLAEDNLVKKIPLFDYIYSGYGLVRLDGFLYADELAGNSYYYIAAYTTLNGGIPEYNYEFSNVNSNNLKVSEMNLDMFNYIGYLGDVRCGYGKDYLVYGNMVQAPNMTLYGQQDYDYIQQRFNLRADGGVVVFDKIISSAYEYNNKIAVFLCNTTMKDMTIKYAINTKDLYNITSGDIYLINSSGSTKLTNITNNEALINLTLKSHEVIMLQMDK